MKESAKCRSGRNLSHVDDHGLAVTGLALFALEPGSRFVAPERLASEFSGSIARTGDAVVGYL